MAKIGLLIPSRERLNLKLTLISSIITTANDIDNIRLYFGIDDDDPTKPIVEKISHAIPFVNIIPIHNQGKFIGINNIWNILAAHCSDEIFGYIGDDMIFKTQNWDIKILEEFRDKNCPPDRIKMVHVDDGHHGSALSVNAFMDRKYYDVMGYFCKGDFLINYSDSWMYQMMKAFNRVTYLPNILIQHNHWVFGGRPRDGVANRMLSDNHDRHSDQKWAELRETHKQDIRKLGAYLNMEPDWTKVDP